MCGWDEGDQQYHHPLIPNFVYQGPTVVYTPDGVTRALFEEGVARFPAPGQVIGHNGKSRW